MKNLLLILLIVGSVFLSACDDKEAREYASKMIPVLETYQEQISQKIKAEQTLYDELASAYDEARKNDFDERITNDRKRRADVAGERMAGSSGKTSLSQIIDSLQDYAKFDFDTTKTLLEEDLNTRSQYLNNLESLEIELQKIKALKEALQDLAKPKSDFKKFKQATDFILETDKEINKLLCTDLGKQIDDLDKQISELNSQISELDGQDSDEEDVKKKSKLVAEKKKVEQKKQSVKERKNTKNCS